MSKILPGNYMHTVKPVLCDLPREYSNRVA